MKKRLIVIAVFVALAVSLIPSVGVSAVDIAGVYYNFHAAANEPALTIEFSKGLKTQFPDLSFKADQFVILPQERTVADVEARITSAVLDKLVRVIQLSQLEPDEGAVQNPPILKPSEQIVGNRLYRYQYYFAIHIYSLEVGNLNFVTRFQQGKYGAIPDGWWEQ